MRITGEDLGNKVWFTDHRPPMILNSITRHPPIMLGGEWVWKVTLAFQDFCEPITRKEIDEEEFLSMLKDGRARWG